MSNQEDLVWDAVMDVCDNIWVKNNTIDLSKKLEDIEKTAIIDALYAHQNNRTRAAESLGIGRTLLIHKIKKYGLS
jgi:transcriptional regulator with PAS, ATPase and Fis domain